LDKLSSAELDELLAELMIALKDSGTLPAEVAADFPELAQSLEGLEK